MNLSDADILRLLPEHIARDPAFQAAGSAMRPLLRKLAASIPNLLIYARLGKQEPAQFLPPLKRLTEARPGLAPITSELVDLLAWQFHVDGYEAATSLEAKRRMTLASIPMHRRKGTPWAVRHALESAFLLKAELHEWFAYGGEPYFFRAAIDVSDAYWGEAYSPNAWRVINEYKNLRSWLEYLVTRARTRLTEHVGIGASGLTSVKTCLYFAPKAAEPLARFPAQAISGLTKSETRLWFQAKAMPEPRARILVENGLTRTKIEIFRRTHA